MVWKCPSCPAQRQQAVSACVVGLTSASRQWFAGMQPGGSAAVIPAMHPKTVSSRHAVISTASYGELETLSRVRGWLTLIFCRYLLPVNLRDCAACNSPLRKESQILCLGHTLPSRKIQIKKGKLGAATVKLLASRRRIDSISPMPTASAEE